MLDLFWLLATPDAQPGDWYGWLTVFAAHALVVGAPIGALMLALRWPQAVGAVLYWLWETVQIVMFGGVLTDSLVDWSAVALGQALVWAAWRGRRKVLAGAGGALALIAAIGVWRRSK